MNGEDTQDTGALALAALNSVAGGLATGLGVGVGVGGIRSVSRPPDACVGAVLCDALGQGIQTVVFALVMQFM